MISFVKIMALMTPEIQRRPKAFKIFLAGKATKFGNQNQCRPYGPYNQSLKINFSLVYWYIRTTEHAIKKIIIGCIRGSAL